MNDFLKHLAAQRQETGTREAWDAWKADHVSEGCDIWDVSNSKEAYEAVTSFLSMVPPERFQLGLLLTAPPWPYWAGNPEPGVMRTKQRMLALPGAQPAAVDAWRRDGASVVNYIPVMRNYTDDGFPARDVYLILEDGRLSDQPGPLLYETMAKWVVENGL